MHLPKELLKQPEVSVWTDGCRDRGRLAHSFGKSPPCPEAGPGVPRGEAASRALGSPEGPRPAVPPGRRRAESALPPGAAPWCGHLDSQLPRADSPPRKSASTVEHDPPEHEGFVPEAPRTSTCEAHKHGAGVQYPPGPGTVLGSQAPGNHVTRSCEQGSCGDPATDKHCTGRAAGNSPQPVPCPLSPRGLWPRPLGPQALAPFA